MADPLVDRIRQLRRTREVWQGDIIRVPQWLAEQGKPPVRPWVAILVNLENGRVQTGPLKRPFEKGFDALLEAFLPSGSNPVTGIRPEKIQVRTPGLAEFLRQKLEGLVEVELVDQLPGIAAVQAQMLQKMSVVLIPPATTGQGVTIERLARFNAAAEKFLESSPWRFLSDEDYIQIESPAPPNEKLSGAVIMGAGGRAFGMAYYKNREEHRDLHQATDVQKFYRKHGGIWSILFGDITTLPPDDADLVEDEELPRPRADKGYAVPKFFDGQAGNTRRPNAQELAFMEGVFLALAETSEAELDQARWTRRIQAADGEVEFRFSLPELLEEPQAPSGPGPSHSQLRSMERALDRLQRITTEKEFNTAEEAQAYLDQLERETKPDTQRELTPKERAQDLVDIAWHSWGRRRRQLIRRALEIDPDCPDAYVLMGASERDPAKALEHYQKAVDAGERSLGADVMQQNAGEFWNRLETRPYMRARMALAENLRELKRTNEAIEHFKEMIRLSPTDQQGARLRLAACLLQQGDNEQLESLFHRFDGERAALWAYARALWKFRREGDNANSRKEIQTALEANHFAPNYLLRKKELPAVLPASYTPNSEAEGIVIALELIGPWEATPNATHWLAEQKRKKRDRDDRKRHER